MKKEYVVAQRYEGPVYCSTNSDDKKILNIGDKLFLDTDNGFFFTETGEPICNYKSSIAINHLIYNEDNKWEERSKLVYKIAWEPRQIKSESVNGNYRFTDKQARIIKEKYDKFIMPIDFGLIFNEKLNDASIEELQKMLNDLELTI